MKSVRSLFALSMLILASLACQPLNLLLSPQPEPTASTPSEEDVEQLVETIVAQTIEAQNQPDGEDNGNTTTAETTPVPEPTTGSDETSPTQVPTETTTDTTAPTETTDGGTSDTSPIIAPLTNANPNWQTYIDTTLSGNDFGFYGDIAMVNVTNGDNRVLTSYGFNRNPQLSPDGSLIAYQSVPASQIGGGDYYPPYDQAQFNIWAITADGTQAWQFTDSASTARSNPQWSPTDSGRLAWIDGSNWIMVGQFGDSLVREYPVPNITDFAWDPYGERFAVISDGSLRLIHTADGVSEQLLVDTSAEGDNANVIDVAWFNDREHLAYTITDQSGCVNDEPVFFCEKKSIVFLNTTTLAEVHRIADAQFPIIAPDNSKLIVQQGTGYGDACGVDLSLALVQLGPDLKPTSFQSLPEFQLPEILQADSGGSGPFPSNYDNSVWVTNNQLMLDIAVPCSNTNSTNGTYLLDTNNVTLTQLSTGNTPFNPAQETVVDQMKAAGANPSQTVVGLTDATNDGIYGDIIVMNADGSNYRQLTTYGYNSDPVLSPDGTRIAYRSVPQGYVTDGLVTFDPFNVPFNIWIINVDGTNAIQVTSTEDSYRSVPTWSPFGDYLAFAENDMLIEYNVANGDRIEWPSFALAPKYAADNETLWYINGNGALERRSRLTGETTIFASTDLLAGPVVESFIMTERPFEPGVSDILFTVADYTAATEGAVQYVPRKTYQTVTNAVETYEGNLVIEDVQPDIDLGNFSLVARTGSGISEAGCASDLGFFVQQVGYAGPQDPVTLENLTILPLADLGIPLYLPQHQPMHKLSDRMFLAYFANDCAEGEQVNGWYAIDLVYKTATKLQR